VTQHHRFSSYLHHLSRQFALGFALLFIAGCAHISSEDPAFRGQNTAIDAPQWSGRLALRVEDQPTQSFSASFELRGSVESGYLKLFSPLGSVVAELQWTPASAWLRAPGRTEQYDDLQALITQANGSPLPVDALFDWLNGKPSKHDEWTVALDQYPQGRVVARRETPATELRIVLDQP
jgi:outer membrane lipoprotein LolB